MIVVVNKMDATEPMFSEKRFDQISTQIFKYIQQIGYRPLTLVFSPISGLHGDNLIEASENMSWFAPWTIQRRTEYITGRTLWQAIDALIRSDSFVNKPLRLPLDDVYKIGGIGTVPVGRVATGVLKPGMIVNFAPSNLSSPVKALEMRGCYDEAMAGDYTGFSIQGIKVNELRRGFVCSDMKNDPAQEVINFTAYVGIFSLCSILFFMFYFSSTYSINRLRFVRDTHQCSIVIQLVYHVNLFS